MKKIAVVLSVAAILSACSSTKDVYTQRVVQEQERQDLAAERAVDKAPEWMTKLPKSANAVYENGTAVAKDFAIADMMAKTFAYAKICTAAGGTIRQQTKMFGTENGTSMEMAVRSICKDIDITGVETVDMKHISENGQYRTYALVALPIGNANTLKKEADERAQREGMRRNASDAFKELDSIVDGKPTTKTETLQLLDVDNAAYKAKRDETLQKPNAVIGQTTIR
jgi:hypothetical protein